MPHFNEETIKFSHPYQEMFVGEFQNGWRASQFNESLTEKPAVNMDKVMNQAERYING